MDNLINEINHFDITSVCFELIKLRDGLEFHKALYGDFVVIMIKSNGYRNGYINATKLCQDGGKRLDNWTRLEGSKRLIEVFNIELASSDVRELNFCIPVSGTNTEDLLISGTYFHSDVIVHIACWLSPQFAFKVSKIVNSFITYHFQKTYAGKIEMLQQICNKYEQRVQELKPIAAPYTGNQQLHNCFLIVKKNNPTDSYPYCTIRVQKRNLKRALHMVNEKYPDNEIIYKKDQDPNSLKLFRLMQEELPIETKGICFKSNINEDELLKSVDTLYNNVLGF